MFKKLRRKNEKNASKLPTANTQQHSQGNRDNDDYAEGNAKTTLLTDAQYVETRYNESASPESEGSAPSSQGVGAGKDDDSDDASTEDPRAALAQAMGSSNYTLAQVNTVLKIVTVSLAALSLVLGIMASIAWNQEVQYRYFFVSSDGTVTERVPMSTPMRSLNNVRDFYVESLSHLFSFHYNNFADHYQRLAPEIMTEQAMIEFSQELDRIGLIQSMRERAEVAEAVILQTPTLIASGEDPVTGIYTWELSVPFNLRLESGRQDNRQTNNVRRLGGVARVQIIRVEPTEHPRQIMINRITIQDTFND